MSAQRCVHTHAYVHTHEKPSELGCVCLSHHATVICTSLLRTCHGYQEAFCTHLPTIWAWKWVTKTIQMKMTQLFVSEAFAKILPSLLPPNPTTDCFLAPHSTVFPWDDSSDCLPQDVTVPGHMPCHRRWLNAVCEDLHGSTRHSNTPCKSLLWQARLASLLTFYKCFLSPLGQSCCQSKSPLILRNV